MSTVSYGRARLFPAVRNRDRALTIGVEDVNAARRSTDEDLMTRLAANDSNALELLFDRYSRLVLSIALRILRDYGEAEEVVQEVFFHLFQRPRLFDSSKGAAKAWIAKIALRRALDRKSHLDRRGFYLGTNPESLDDTLVGGTDLDREIGARLNRVQLEKAFE
ncbi:MAG TPA: sigma factor, partial [Terriglobia bacterium]|nr:sigma factor [Terriglobia bacterium]